MADNTNYYDEHMTDTERESVGTLIAEGKHDRARMMVKEQAGAKDIVLSDADVDAVLDHFTSDLSADEATLAHFPDKRNKSAMGMDMEESIVDPANRRAPAPSEVSPPEEE